MADSKLTNVLVLTFSEGSKDRRLRVPNPRNDLTGAEVKNVMDIVASNNFIWTGVTPKSAKVVKTTTDQIDITVE